MTDQAPEAPQLIEQPDIEIIGSDDDDAPVIPGLCLPFA
jgi:hypothetical protein